MAGRRIDVTARQVTGLALVLVAAAGVLPLGPAPVGPEAWIAVGAGAVLFMLEPVHPVRWLLDHAGGIIAAALTLLLLLGSGGPDSIFQDFFVVILVYSAIVNSWRRVAVDVLAVAVAATAVGWLSDADGAFYADLAADLLIWVLVAVLAGVIERRMRVAMVRSHRLRTVIDNVEDVVTVIDTDTMRIDYTNREAGRILDRPRDDVIGRHPWELNDAMDEQSLRRLVASLEVGGPAAQLEQVSHRTEPPRSYETSARLVPGGDKGAQLVLIARDVTDKRREEVAARERAAMVEAADLAMIGTDQVGWIRSWNRAAEELYGVPRDEAVGQHVAGVLGGPPDDPAGGREPFPPEQRFIRYSTQHTRADGEHFDAEVTAWPVAAATATASGVALLVRDVTEQRRVAHALREREERFRTFAEQASGVVYRVRVEPQLEMTYIGPRVTEVLGDDPADLIPDPTPLLERIHPDDGHPFQAVDGERRWEDEGVHTYRVQRTDGTWVWLEDHHRPERDATGRVVTTQGILFDVSSRKELDEARRQALEHERRLARELERTTMAQQTFLRSISHELRTPLTSVRGFAHTLRTHRARLGGDVTDQLLARLVANVERLDTQLADLLDLDLGTSQPDRDRWQDVELRSLGLAAISAVDANGHEFELAVGDETVHGDRVRLGRAVTSLLHNAVRHTPPGTVVTISATVGAGCVELHVIDDGPGVDPDIGDTLFEPFVQGEQAGTDASPGAGVGLALAREVAALHGGTLEYSRVSPCGSRFTLTLPQRPAEA